MVEKTVGTRLRCRLNDIKMDLEGIGYGDDISEIIHCTYVLLIMLYPFIIDY
jgi:hypothetical protein